MPIPTTITFPAGSTQVVFEVEDTANYITPRDDNGGFGTVVLIGSGVTLYAVGNIVLGKNCSFFNEAGYMYGTAVQSDILLIYTVPP